MNNPVPNWHILDRKIFCSFVRIVKKTASAKTDFHKRIVKRIVTCVKTYKAFKLFYPYFNPH